MARPCGWTTSCRCHLNWAQYQMKSQHGRHDVGETSVEGKTNARDISCLKVREERPTTQVDELPSLSFAEAEAVAG